MLSFYDTSQDFLKSLQIDIFNKLYTHLSFFNSLELKGQN